MIRNVSFDVFGTLVERKRPTNPLKDLVRFGQAHGQGSNGKARDVFMIHPWDVEACLAYFNLTPQDVPPTTWDAWQQAWGEEAAGIQAFDDVEAVLNTLRQRGYRLALASNLAHPYMAMAQHALRAVVFDRYVWSCEIGSIKPHGSFFQAVVGEDDPGSWLHVGDTWHDDVQGAFDAGLHTVWLQRPQTQPSMVTRAIPNVRCVNSLSGLLDHLPDLNV